MRQVFGVAFKYGSREELLPELDEAFPCVTTCYGFEKGGGAPWHWHQAVELFYVERGTLAYATPQGRALFLEGWGGVVNAGVPHMTAATTSGQQLLHLLSPALLSGGQGSCIERKFVLPFTASGPALLPLVPDRPGHAAALEKLRHSFLITPEDSCYELRLRAALSELWADILTLAAPLLEADGGRGAEQERLKLMMIYIQENCAQPLRVAELAAAAYVSERTCFSLFRRCLGTTPTQYIQSCRLRMARDMLAHGDQPVTEIAQACGLGSSSYLARLLREETGRSPLAYRAACRGREEKKG